MPVAGADAAHHPSLPSHLAAAPAASRFLAPRVRRGRNAGDDGRRTVAVVLRRGMRVDDYRRLEAEAATRAVSCLPVIAGDSRSRGWPAEGVCALIVTGSDHRPSQQERAQIDAAVRHAVRARIPTLAMSDGGDLALAAAGFELPTEQENAVLIHRGVEVLETDACVQDALERVLEG